LSRLRLDPEQRPAHLDREELAQSLVEIRENAVVAAVAGYAVREHDLRVSDRLGKRVLLRREIAVVGAANEATPTLAFLSPCFLRARARLAFQPPFSFQPRLLSHATTLASLSAGASRRPPRRRFGSAIC